MGFSARSESVSKTSLAREGACASCSARAASPATTSTSRRTPRGTPTSGRRTPHALTTASVRRTSTRRPPNYQIQALADLRLVHPIGNLSVQTGNYRGRRFVGFTLDLSNYTGTRSERITQIDFWTPTGKQATRRARLIYTPGASSRAPARGPEEDEALEGPWGDQTNIYDFLPEESPASSVSQQSPSASSQS